jgi:hypothetical protein
MAYEFLKLCVLKFYWDSSLNRSKHPMGFLIESLYFIFMVYLFFIHYWYIGLCIFIVSIITAFQLNEDFMNKTNFNKNIKHYLVVDGLVSIILLLVIIFKELVL